MPEGRSLALIQGAYYLATGLWPLLHLRSFLACTGPKTDLWLVKTAGLLIACVGGSLLLAGAGGPPPVSASFLGASAAFCLAAVDVVYAAKRVIAPVYLVDAAAEAALLALWLAPG